MNLLHGFRQGMGHLGWRIAQDILALPSPNDRIALEIPVVEDLAGGLNGGFVALFPLVYFSRPVC